MKLLPLVELIVVNGVLLAFLVWVTGDCSYRAAYWKPEGFTPTLTRYPFFMITSATNGSSSIGGLLSVDWQQVLVVLLVAVDLVYAWSALKSRNKASA